MSNVSTQVVLVTGAAGLIGREVCRLARGKGWSVVATDIAAPPDLDLDLLDIREADRTAELCQRRGVDTIIHCGGFSGGMVGADKPGLVIEVNVGGTARLLEVARLSGVRRFVYASTATVYGRTEGVEPLDESTTVRPQGIYGASKAAAELLIRSYRQDYGLDAVSLRLSWIYGPYRVNDCVIRKMLLSALAGIDFTLPFGRDFPRQYLTALDAALALLGAANRGTTLTRPEYNVGPGQVTTLAEVGELIAQIVPGSRISLSTGDDPADVRQGRFDIAAATTDLGFTPTVGLREGIASYAEWLRKHANAA